MGYTATGSLEDLFPEHFVEEANARISKAVSEEWLKKLKKKTPVAKLPEAYKGDAGEWIEDRGGRRPGTARDSWETGEFEVTAEGAVVEVKSDDPVMPHIEWDTRPHVIRARKPDGWLRFPSGPVFRFARRVFHPGTDGQHMMRDSGAEMETEWVAIAERELERMAAGR